MARFRFNLNGVLKHRRFVERQKQRALAVIQLEMSKLQLEIKEVEVSGKQATESLRNGKLVGQIDLAYLGAHRRYMLALERKAVSIAQKMALVQRDITKAQGELLEAAKARKALERLRERAFERWSTAREMAEAKEMDEIGTRLATTSLDY